MQFRYEQGQFIVDDVKFHAAVEHTIPSEPGSWGDMQGYPMLNLVGLVKIDWPCQSKEDPETGEMIPIPLFFGHVTAKMAMGPAEAPVKIDDAEGWVKYMCVGLKQWEVMLEVDQLRTKFVSLVGPPAQVPPGSPPAPSRVAQLTPRLLSTPETEI